MAEILFVTWDGGGNLPPTLALARELVQRGHGVRFLGHLGATQEASTAGLELVAPRWARPFSSTARHSAAGMPLEMIRTFSDRGLGRDLVAALDRRPVDLVVVDCLMFGALEAARRSGVRFAVLEHFLDEYYERGCLRGPLGLSLRLQRLRPRAGLAAAAVRVVTSIPELDHPAGRGRVTHTGAVVEVGRPDPGRADDPLVLVSLSTFRFPGMVEVLQRAVDATAGLGARVVVTTGAVDPAELRTPAGVEVHPFVPHSELMPHASLLVGHGGHGTTLQALAHDLPVLVVPMDRLSDQPLVGRSVARAGAGRVVAKRSPVGTLRAAAAALLADGPHCAAAARLGTAVRARPGALVGADALEGALG